MAKNVNIWVEKRLIMSAAFAALKRPSAFRVLLIFLTKRQVARVGYGRYKEWTISNNGEIQFTYREAKKKYGISSGTFRAAIDELRDKGFIDIAESGAGLYRSKNRYTISDRWLDYGTPDYRPPKPRPRGPMNKGFRKGNRYGRNCEKTDSTVRDNRGSTVAHNSN